METVRTDWQRGIEYSLLDEHDRRLYDDTTTWLAEALDGPMRAPFEYRFDGRELYGRDGSPLGMVFRNSIDDAYRIVREKPNLAFELRRRHIEYGEYQDMLAMARGEGPNTMFVISDFPPELMDATENVGGYNITRKQTFLRVIARRTNGSINIWSQTLDGSDRAGLDAVCRSLGFQPRPGELLGQRMRMDVDDAEQEFMTDWLTGAYDRSLQARTGVEHYGGRPGAARRNTYDFVRAQTDLLAAFRKGLNAGIDKEKLLLGLAESMQSRLDGNAFSSIGVNTVGFGDWLDSRPADMVHDAALRELISSSNRAFDAGTTYSGCGLQVGGPPGSEGELQESGYGNKSDDKTEYKFDKFMFCVGCQAPPEQGAQKQLCGPCGLCKPCDTVAKLKSPYN
jgi:hypothetical protein